MRAERLLVTVVVTGDVLLKIDSLVRARPANAFLVEGDRRLARFLIDNLAIADAGEAPAILEPLDDSARVPRATLRALLATSEEVLAAIPAPDPALSADPGGEVRAARQGVVTFHASQIALRSDPDERARPARGVTIQQVEAGAGRAVQLTATRASCSPTGRPARRLLAHRRGAGVYLEGDVVATDGSYTLRGARLRPQDPARRPRGRGLLDLRRAARDADLRARRFDPAGVRPSVDRARRAADQRRLRRADALHRRLAASPSGVRRPPGAAPGGGRRSRSGGQRRGRRRVRQRAHRPDPGVPAPGVPRLARQPAPAKLQFDSRGRLARGPNDLGPRNPAEHRVRPRLPRPTSCSTRTSTVARPSAPVLVARPTHAATSSATVYDNGEDRFGTGREIDRDSESRGVLTFEHVMRSTTTGRCSSNRPTCPTRRSSPRSSRASARHVASSSTPRT